MRQRGQLEWAQVILLLSWDSQAIFHRPTSCSWTELTSYLPQSSSFEDLTFAMNLPDFCLTLASVEALVPNWQLQCSFETHCASCNGQRSRTAVPGTRRPLQAQSPRHSSYSPSAWQSGTLACQNHCLCRWTMTCLAESYCNHPKRRGGLLRWTTVLCLDLSCFRHFKRRSVASKRHPTTKKQMQLAPRKSVTDQ